MKTTRIFSKKFIAVFVILMLVFAACITIGAVALSANAESSAQTATSYTTVDENLDDNNGAAEPETSDDDTSSGSSVSGKAIAAGLAIGLAALGGAIGMGIAISKACEGISRQPEAEGKVRNTLMLGLVFVETVVIYALIVSVLLIFVM